VLFYEPITTPLTLTFWDELFCKIKMAEVLAANDHEDEKKPFVTLNEEQFKNLLYEKDAKNNQRATQSAVRTFKSYLRENKLR
jgi:hypothetical protein